MKTHLKELLITVRRNLSFLVVALALVLVVSMLFTYGHSVSKLHEEGSTLIYDEPFSGSVSCFALGTRGDVWIGTDAGLYRYNGAHTERFFQGNNDTTSIPGNNITDLLRDRDGRIWIATTKGIACYDGNDRFKRIKQPNGPYDTRELVQMKDGRIAFISGKYIYTFDGTNLKPFAYIGTSSQTWFYTQARLSSDRYGCLWLSSPRRIRAFDVHGRKVADIPNRNNPNANMCTTADYGDLLWVAQSRHILCIDKRKQQIIYNKPQEIEILPSIMVVEDKNRLLIKSHKYGLFIFNPVTGNTRKVSKEEFFPTGEGQFVSALMFSDRGTLLVGFRSNGFDFLTCTERKLMRKNPLMLQTHTSGRSVTHLSTDGKVLWGGIDDNIFRYDIRNDEYQEIPLDGLFNDSPYFRQQLKAIRQLNNGELMIVTDVRFAVCRYEGNRLRHKEMINSGLNTSGCLAVGDTSFIVSSMGKLLMHIDGQNGYDTIIVNDDLYSLNTIPLTFDGRNLNLLCEKACILDVDITRRKTKRLHIIRTDDSDNIAVTCAYADKSDLVWIGSHSQGLFLLDISSGRLTRAPISLPESRITNITGVPGGKICITTDRHAYLCDPDRKMCVEHRIMTFGNASSYIINPDAVACLYNGTIVLGTNNGCRLITRYDFKKQKDGIYIDKFEVTTSTNRLFSAGDSVPEKITLNHDRNDISILMGNSDWERMTQYFHSYKLEGYDKNWHDNEDNSRISYTNLPPGRYVFRLRSSGNIASPELKLYIRILPPFYLSWQALALYFIALVLLAYRMNRLYLLNKMRKLQLEEERKETEREWRNNEMNKRFFANVSHEFRNPLTMIAGPIMTMKRDESLSVGHRRRLNIVALNVKRMLQLIDQMLDFNKLDDDVLQLQVEHIDLSELLNTLATILREAASYHGISVEDNGFDTAIPIWVDRDKVEKIMDNLTTNALKHTPDGGLISIICSHNDTKRLTITVENSGRNIPDDKLKYVFKRYYQVKETTGQHQYGFGTGIGLYYVSQLVRLHHGTITVRNLTEGGVAFSFTLPLGDVYSEREKASNAQNKHDIIPVLNISGLENNTPADVKPLMLVIDDDTQMSLYIRSIFTDRFNVKNLYSTESALEWLKDNSPDIILSDIVMNEMSGLELCRTLKQDVNYSHIPIILVSGKSNISEQIEGLKEGAVAYIVKPFDPDMLKALVESQLRNMEEVRRKLNEGVLPKDVADKLSMQDRHFMDELYRLMDEQICMEGLNISTVCGEMHVSRSKFNYKMKALTGMTPSSYFRLYKLNRAAQLLKTGECNVSEAALRTGFDNISYFSTVFKKQFGVSPSEYK